MLCLLENEERKISRRRIFTQLPTGAYYFGRKMSTSNDGIVVYQALGRKTKKERKKVAWSAFKETFVA